MIYEYHAEVSSSNGSASVIRRRERQIRRLQRKELRLQQSGRNIEAGKARREYESLAKLNARKRGSSTFVPSTSGQWMLVIRSGETTGDVSGPRQPVC